jgi:phage shock protein A
MGVWNFMVDMSQEGRLNDHAEEIEKLQRQVEQMALWIAQLKNQIEELKNERSAGH